MADNEDVNDANSNKPDYFRSSINRAAHKRANQVLMNKIHNEFSYIFFSGIGCFEDMFSLQVAPRRVSYALQAFLMEELEILHKHQVILPLGMDETLEWCSFIMVPKANSKL